MEIYTSALGYLALGISIIGFSLVDDAKLKRINLAGCLVWISHFTLMGETSAAMMLALASVMVASSIVGWKSVTNAAWLINILLVPSAGAMILVGAVPPAAILPILGGFFINTGVARCSGHAMTVTIAIGHILWIIAAVMMWSVPAIIANVVNLVALLFREWQRQREDAPANSLSTKSAHPV